jgi:hypothetical protein
LDLGRLYFSRLILGTNPELSSGDWRPLTGDKSAANQQIFSIRGQVAMMVSNKAACFLQDLWIYISQQYTNTGVGSWDEQQPALPFSYASIDRIFQNRAIG